MFRNFGVSDLSQGGQGRAPDGCGCLSPVWVKDRVLCSWRGIELIFPRHLQEFYKQFEEPPCVLHHQRFITSVPSLIIIIVGRI